MSEDSEEQSPILGSNHGHSNYDSIATINRSRSSTHKSVTSLDGQTSDDVPDETSYKNWTRRQWIVLLTQNMLIFCSCIGYSLPSTFFPQEASKKGASSLSVGLIFGIYELVVFITSPIFGALIVKLTPRYLCLAGNFIAGGCCVLFGFLQWCPDGAIFITMCFIVRIVDAIGASMATVSGYAILSLAFPHHVAVVNGVAETLAGLGFMVGPVVGAFLYNSGGFLTPFAAIGGLSLLSTLAAFFSPDGVNEETTEQSTLTFYKLLKNPGISVLFLHVFGCSVALTFLDPIFSQWLETNFSISVVIVGLVFLIWSGVYTLSSPVMGKLTEKGFIYSLMIPGGFFCFLSLMLMGPSPLIEDIFTIKKELWLVCIICVVLGVSCAAMFIPPYMAAINLVTKDGHSLDANAYGIVSGLISSAGSLGSFAGPTLAGYFNQKWGFEWSLSACGFLVFTTTAMMSVYCIIMWCRDKMLSTTTKDLVCNLQEDGESSGNHNMTA